MNKNFQEVINTYSNNLRDPQTNLLLGQFYDEHGQNAGAISFYLRAAELTEDINVAYECLVRNALLIDRLQRRPFSSTGQLLHAIQIVPTRPEAYYHLTRFYEQKKEWQEIYTLLTLANRLREPYQRSTSLDLDYPGDYVLDFQKGVAAWWMNRGGESIKIFKTLLGTQDMREDFVRGCKNNLARIDKTS